MLTALIGPVSKLVGKFIEDKDQKNKLAHDLATLASRHAQELAKGQIEANTQQAKHPSLFVAGARPAIMWICALGLLTQFFIMPIAEWATCLLYTSDAADEGLGVDLGGRRIIKKKALMFFLLFSKLLLLFLLCLRLHFFSSLLPFVP